MRKRHSPNFKAETVIEVLKEDQTINQIASEKKIHPNQIYDWKAHALKEIHTLFESQGKRDAEPRADYEKRIHELYAEIGKLTTQLEWLERNLVSNLSQTERVALVEHHASEFSLKTQCELLGLNRPGSTISVSRPRLKRSPSMHRIDETYTECPFVKYPTQLHHYDTRSQSDYHPRRVAFAVCSILRARMYDSIMYPFRLLQS